MGLGDKVDNAAQDVTGRAKEAAGAISGDKELKSEGKRDQAAAAAKDAVEDVKDKAGEAVDAIKDKFDKN